MEHFSTILVLALIAAAFLGVIIRGILRKKAGKPGCCGSCSGCASRGTCHPDNKK